MKSKIIKNFSVTLFFLILLVFHLKTLTLYPEASVDESWLSSDGISIIDHNYTKINFPFFLNNKGLSYFPKLTLGIYYKIFGLGLLQGRLFIFFQSILLLFLTYKFTVKFFGKQFSLLSVIFLASTTVFFFSSHLIRFDIPFTGFLLLSLWSFFLYLKTKKIFFCFLSGLILGFSYEVWVNGILFQASFVLTWILFQISLKKLTIKPFVFFLIGLFVYWCFYILVNILPDVKSFEFTSNYMFKIDHSTPLFSLSIKEIIISEASRYKAAFSVGGWWELILILIVLFKSLISKNIYVRFLSIYIFVSALMLGLLSSNKAFFYLIYLLPMVSILVSQVAKNQAGIIKNFVLFLIIAVIGFNFLRQFNIARDYSGYDYLQATKVFTPYFTNNSLILGEAHYYLPLKDFKYSNIILLTWYRIFENLNPYQAISKINPDYIIVDPFIEGRLVDDESKIKNTDFQRGLHNVSKKDFMRFIDEKTTYITSFYSKLYYGEIKLYKVNK